MSVRGTGCSTRVAASGLGPLRVHNDGGELTMEVSVSASTVPDMPTVLNGRRATVAVLAVLLVTVTGCWQSNIKNTVDFYNLSGVVLTFRTETGSHETTASGGGEAIFIVPEGSCLDEEVLAIDRDGRIRARQDGLCGGDQWTIHNYELEPPGPRFDDPDAETF